ncbi:hypothetical protein ACFPOU_23755 [Massilia jejuensis]|uniref:CdiI immunity protein domain-containing protein n=1 Tax=Massilia jejuensis TaxID=648894 RepID=A0ABW0PQZ0_9BURK
MTTQPIHYLHSISSDPNDWTEEWMRALGYIAYYFGQLEYASVWLADYLRTVVSNDGFSKRCDDACKRLVPTLPDDALRADWNAFFNTVAVHWTDCAPP